MNTIVVKGERPERKPYALPESECERLRKSEMTAIKMMLTMLSIAANVMDDLSDRLTWVPRGRWRCAAAVGAMRAVINDVLGTIPETQKRQIQGTMKNYKVQVVPSATPLSTNVVMTRDQAAQLVTMAKDRCTACTEDGYSCRKCPLYKFMEATSPIEDYGSGMSCPYSLVKWG